MRMASPEVGYEAILSPDPSPICCPLPVLENLPDFKAISTFHPKVYLH